MINLDIDKLVSPEIKWESEIRNNCMVQYSAIVNDNVINVYRECTRRAPGTYFALFINGVNYADRFTQYDIEALFNRIDKANTVARDKIHTANLINKFKQLNLDTFIKFEV